MSDQNIVNKLLEKGHTEAEKAANRISKSLDNNNSRIQSESELGLLEQVKTIGIEALPVLEGYNNRLKTIRVNSKNSSKNKTKKSSSKVGVVELQIALKDSIEAIKKLIKSQDKK